jgi:hypothetical protein
MKYYYDMPDRFLDIFPSHLLNSWKEEEHWERNLGDLTSDAPHHIVLLSFSLHQEMMKKKRKHVLIAAIQVQKFTKETNNSTPSYSC